MGNCSDALITQLENQHIRAARIIYEIPEKICNHDVLSVRIKCLGPVSGATMSSKFCCEAQSCNYILAVSRQDKFYQSFDPLY